MEKKRILVTGTGGASGICTILALKESTSHTIIGCDCNKYSSGLYLAHESFIVPPAVKENFLEEIIKKVKRYKIDIIFPNVDEELLVFAKYKSKIPSEIIISPFPTIDICNDKLKLLSEMEKVVPIPLTKNISPPFFVKPRTGRGSRNAYEVKSKEELQALFKHLSFKGMNKKDFVTQEFLPNKEYTVDALFDMKGNLIVAVPRERIKTFGGASLVGRTIKNRKLITFVKKISKKLEFFGPVNFQFKEDKSRVPKLLEINPRCSGGMAITLKSGVNLPKLMLDIIEKKKISKKELQWEEKTAFRYMTEI